MENTVFWSRRQGTVRFCFLRRLRAVTTETFVLPTTQFLILHQNKNSNPDLKVEIGVLNNNAIYDTGCNRPTSYNLRMVFDGIGDGVVVVGQDGVDAHV